MANMLNFILAATVSMEMETTKGFLYSLLSGKMAGCLTPIRVRLSLCPMFKFIKRVATVMLVTSLCQVRRTGVSYVRARNNGGAGRCHFPGQGREAAPRS